MPKPDQKKKRRKKEHQSWATVEFVERKKQDNNPYLETRGIPQIPSAFDALGGGWSEESGVAGFQYELKVHGRMEVPLKSA